MNILRMPRWSPYAVGALIGVLSWATFYFMDKALGTSTSMSATAAACTSLIAPDHAAANAYNVKEFYDAKGAKWKPFVDWQMALVLMLAVGALISAALSRTLKGENVPSLWASRFGPSAPKRFAAAFLGGAILLFGARMAGGCTSGHGISGSLQLAVSSWTFFIAMFISGVITAFALYAGRTSSKAS